MTTRAYVRESTVGQAEKFGPDAQRAAITRACGDLDIPIPESWYTDLITGTGKTVRDSLAQARADARAQAFDVLICYDTSRWARNEREAFDFEHEMKLAGVRVYYAAERIWADDDATALHKGILHVINAQYSRDLSRRIRDGYAAKRAQGGHVGAVPTGYRRDGLTLVPIEAIVVRLLAWSLYATGEHTYATVALELNRRGHRIAWHGQDRAFTRYTVGEILSRDIDLRFGGLDPAIYARARDVAVRHRIHVEHVGQRRHSYVFVSVARCGECGESFWGRMSHDRGSPPRRQLYHAPRGCRRGARDEVVLEKQIGAWLQSWRLPADVLARIARYRSSSTRDQERGARRRTLEAELDRLGKMFRWGHMPESEYLAESRASRAALEQLGPELLQRPPASDIVSLASRIGEAWSVVSVETRRRFVAEWFAELRLARDGSVDVVPRVPVLELVFAAVDKGARVGMVGCAGVQATMPIHRGRNGEVRVVGLEDWRAFWSAEAAG